MEYPSIRTACRASALAGLLLVCVGSGWAASPANDSTPRAVERVERGNLVLEGVPEIPAELNERLRQLAEIRSARFQGWLPEGGILIATRFADTTQLHQVSAPGAARRQLTFFDEPIAEALPNPDPARRGFLFRKDVGGSEFFQLFHFDLDTGSWQLLTDGVSRNAQAVWSRSGDRFAFHTTRRNRRDFDIHVADPRRPGESAAVLEAGGAWTPVDWSPDGERLLVMRRVSALESHPHVLDLGSGELTAIDEGDQAVSYGGGRFSADGRSIYFTSDRDREHRSLRRYDLASGETATLREDLGWGVEGIELSRDGRLLAFSVNEEGMSRLHVMELASGRDLPLPTLPSGVIADLRFSPDDRHLGFTLQTPTAAGDVYSVGLESLTLVRWTESELGGLPREALVAPEIVRYPTFDQVAGERRTIPAFYYRPPGEGPFPVVVLIHGGPESQTRATFNPRLQLWVGELGAAVLAPNVRGSSGYGRGYLALDDGVLREDSVKDIGALLDWIATRPELDAERVAVYGGSYGGYMVLASMVHFGDRLRAGVDVVGISNFVTFLENTEDYRRDLRRVEYGDERDPEMRSFLEAISPLGQAHRISRPLFVIQGANDPRVPASESEQMVRQVRANGGEVWYLLARDEGHGFRKKGNRDLMDAAVALFLERHLLGVPEPAAAGGPFGS